MAFKSPRAFAHFLFLAFCLLFTQHALADVVAGFPDQFKLGKQTLVLNGTGTRVKLFVKAYNAGLYLPEKTTNADEVLSKDTPIAVHLLITSGQSTTERMVNAIKDGFEESTQGNTAPIQSKIDQFTAALSTEVLKLNDTLEFNYLPGKGVTLLKNGSLKTVIPGTDFRQAFYGIWLSNNPVSAKLKAELMGVQP